MNEPQQNITYELLLSPKHLYTCNFPPGLLGTYQKLALKVLCFKKSFRPRQSRTFDYFTDSPKYLLNRLVTNRAEFFLRT